MRTVQLLFLLILIICCINFFDLQSVKGSPVRYLQFGIIIGGIGLAIPHLFIKGKGFIVPVQLIVGSVFFSILIASLSRGQSFIDSFIGSIPILVWIIFFYLRGISPPIETLERIIVGYGILYLILYFFQFTHPANNYFVDLAVVDDSRGILRMVFPGRGLFYLTIFMAITKLTTTQGTKWLWLFLAVIGIFVTVMQVTRQFIFGAVIIYIIHFLRGAGYLKKLIFAMATVLLIGFIWQTDNPVVVGLRDTQEQTQESGVDYIRLQSAEFFLTNFSASSFNQIVGNGVPYGPDSPYYRFYKFYVDNYGFWLSDVGLVAVYAMFGVLAVLGYMLIWLKSFTVSLPEPYRYLKYYLWFLLITSVTSDTIYSPNDLIATVLVVYLYQLIYEWMNAITFSYRA